MMSSMSPRTIRSRVSAARTREKLQSYEKPVKGVLLMITYCLHYSLSIVFVMMLYERVPELYPYPMMFMRSCMSLCFLLLLMNVRLKKKVWDSIPRKEGLSLIVKTFTCGSIKNMITFQTVRYIPATIIMTINSMQSIFLFIFAFLILKETIRKFDILIMVLLVLGITTVVLGDDSNLDLATSNPVVPYYILYVLLALNLLLSANMTIVMRKIKKYDAYVFSWYSELFTVPVSLVIMLSMGRSFTIYGQFDGVAWLYICMAAITNVTSEIVKFKALKFAKATALEIYQPICVLFQLLFDVTVFKFGYTALQFGAIAFVGLVYFAYGLKYQMVDRKRREKRAYSKKTASTMSMTISGRTVIRNKSLNL